jgi:hypothetical protein
MIIRSNIVQFMDVYAAMPLWLCCIYPSDEA